MTKIQFRRDTAANWTTVNPVLAVGEPGIETDTLKEKRGDGITAWSALAYLPDAPAFSGQAVDKGIATWDSTNSRLTYRVSAQVDAKAYGAKGDSSQDDQPGLTAAIAALQARVTAVGGGVGVVDLGFGVYKLGSKLTIPSNIVLKGRVPYGFSAQMGSGAQLQPFGSFADDYVVEFAAGSTGAGLECVTVYMGSTFTGKAVHARGIGSFVDRLNVQNCYDTALTWEVAAGVLANSMLRGFQQRAGAFKTLTGFTGGAFHSTGNARDNFYFNNEFDGGGSLTTPAYTLRSTSQYYCAVYTAGGGVERWFANIFENGDIGIYVAGGRNQYYMNRPEWNAGHGMWIDTNSTEGLYVGNGYNNNGLGQDDRFADLYVAGGRNTFTGERFSRDTSGTIAGITTNAVAVAVYDIATATYVNSYVNCVETGHWKSAPFYTTNQVSPSVLRSDVRAGFPRHSAFGTAPTSGNFTYGESYRVAVGPAAGLWEKVITGGGTLGTLTGVTGTTTAASNQLVVSDGTKVPLGARVNVPGAGYTTTYATVTAKNGNQLTTDVNAVNAVSAVTLTFVAPTVQDYGVQRLSGTATVDPASIAANTDEGTTRTIAVTGAALGDLAVATFSLDLQGVQVRAWVSAANVVSYRFSNPTAAAIDLSSGTVKVWVHK